MTYRFPAAQIRKLSKPDLYWLIVWKGERDTVRKELRAKRRWERNVRFERKADLVMSMLALLNAIISWKRPHVIGNFSII